MDLEGGNRLRECKERTDQRGEGGIVSDRRHATEGALEAPGEGNQTAGLFTGLYTGPEGWVLTNTGQRGGLCPGPCVATLGEGRGSSREGCWLEKGLMTDHSER